MLSLHNIDHDVDLLIGARTANGRVTIGIPRFRFRKNCLTLPSHCAANFDVSTLPTYDPILLAAGPSTTSFIQETNSANSIPKTSVRFRWSHASACRYVNT